MSLRTIIFVVCAIALTGLVLFLANQYPGSLDSNIDQARLIQAVALIVLIGAGLVFSPRLNLKGALKYIVIWGLVGLAVFTAYAFRGEFTQIGARISGELLPAQAVETGQREITIRRGADGHFHLSANVNGTNIRFLVDTGASVVTLSRQDAERTGFDFNDLQFDQQYRTANGTAWGARIRIDTMSAGSIQVDGVRAAILDSELGSSLLGLSFLDKLSEVSVQGDTMTLKK